MNKRALLINPPTGLYIREDRCQAPLDGMAATSARAPLDLCYMAAVLEAAGVECRIRDYPITGGSWTTFRQELDEYGPSMLIISVTSFTIDDDMIACRIAKEVCGSTIMTVAKGAHVSVKSVEVLERNPDLDIAMAGEYELAMRDLVQTADLREIPGIVFRASDGEIVRTEARPYLDDLDAIPYPARHLIDNSLYQRPDTGAPQATIQTSRGCPGKCVYCLGPAVYGSRIRTRSPANVCGELAECIERYGIRDFFFRADTFTWNRRWVIELCDEIVARKMDVRWVCNSRVDTIDAERLVAMKRAGCHGIAFGIESGVQDILDRMKKGITLEKSRSAITLCREHGVTTLLYMIMGLPWETEADIKKSIAFAGELGGDLVEFHLAIPFPGTELFDVSTRDGLFAVESLAGYDYARSPLRTYTVSAERLLSLRRRAFLRTYLRPAAVYRVAKAIIRSAHSPRELWRILKFGTSKMASILLRKQESR